MDFDARAALGMTEVRRLGSLDIPFHGPVNFILRANTDIEDKFAFDGMRQRFSAKPAPHLTATDAIGKRSDNNTDEVRGKILLAKDDMHGPRELNRARAIQNRSRHFRLLLACSIRNSCTSR